MLFLLMPSDVDTCMSGLDEQLIRILAQQRLLQLQQSNQQQQQQSSSPAKSPASVMPPPGRYRNATRPGMTLHGHSFKLPSGVIN